MDINWIAVTTILRNGTDVDSLRRAASYRDDPTPVSGDTLARLRRSA